MLESTPTASMGREDHETLGPIAAVEEGTTRSWDPQPYILIDFVLVETRFRLLSRSNENFDLLIFEVDKTFDLHSAIRSQEPPVLSKFPSSILSMFFSIDQTHISQKTSNANVYCSPNCRSSVRLFFFLFALVD